MEIKYFYPDELKKLFRIIEKSDSRHAVRDLALFRIAYYCGLRVSEVGLLKIGDYNRATGEIYCHRLKNSRNNTVRLDDLTKKTLHKYINGHGMDKSGDILFPSQWAKPIGRGLLDKLMKKYCKSAKLSDESRWHFHALKHSCAVHLAESGLDIKEVQNWLGHKSVANTEIYFQFTTHQQESMYQKLKRHSIMA